MGRFQPGEVLSRALVWTLSVIVQLQLRECSFPALDSTPDTGHQGSDNCSALVSIRIIVMGHRQSTSCLLVVTAVHGWAEQVTQCYLN